MDVGVLLHYTVMEGCLISSFHNYHQSASVCVTP
jgi:hypothetical protein